MSGICRGYVGDMDHYGCIRVLVGLRWSLLSSNRSIGEVKFRSYNKCIHQCLYNERGGKPQHRDAASLAADRDLPA